MERKELYTKIKELGLQEEVKAVYGKNFTQVGNSDLEKIIWNYDCTQASKDPDAPEKKEKEEVVDTPTDKAEDATVTENAYEAACLSFLGILKDTGKLDELLARL